MADVKISALTADTSPTSGDEIVTVDGSTNKRVTLTNAITKAHGLSSGVVAVSSGVMAASTSFSTRAVALPAVDWQVNMSVGDGRYYWPVPTTVNGMDLVRIYGRNITAGTSGVTTIQIANVTDGVDMLSTKLTIDSGETGSDTAATPAVIDTTKDDVVTNDLLRVDVDTITGTPAQGLIIVLEFRLP